MSCRDWVRPANKKTVVLVRFLGSTPVSSSKFSLLVSLCQQLSYNLEIPIEEIPQDFVPLKNYFNLLLEKAGKKFFVVILLGKFGWSIIFFLEKKKNIFQCSMIVSVVLCPCTLLKMFAEVSRACECLHMRILYIEFSLRLLKERNSLTQRFFKSQFSSCS